MSRQPAHNRPRWVSRTGALLLFTLSMLTLNSTNISGAEEGDFETAVCGSLREPLMFWLWHTLAGSPDPGRVAGIQDIEPIQFKTPDGIILSGFKLKAANPKGYLLVAQGNAMLADQLAADLRTFRDRDLDVYLFDYRGYGNSQGRSRLTAIVADYERLLSDLNLRGYQRRFLYGISMGGVILLNAASENRAYDRLVVDSSPSRISNLGCPERYDPLVRLPEDSTRLMFISGGRDNVVPPAQMDEMIRLAQSRGARILRDSDFSHPYQDASEATHRRRQNAVAQFLLEQ